MTPNLPPILRPDAHDPANTSALFARARRRDLERLHHGRYAEAEALEGLSARQRHVVRVHAAMSALHPRLVVSHESAAALHRLPNLDEWPDRGHVIDPARSSAQAWNGVAKHAGPVDAADIAIVDGIRVTSIARTVADIALARPLEQAVVVLDHVLRRRLVTASEIEARLDARPKARGRVSARAALAFASRLAQSPGESFARVLIRRLGAPDPVLQQPFHDAFGHIGDVDFWFAEQGVVLEFDGFVKYSANQYLKGRAPADVVVDEKRREDRIRAVPGVNGFARCLWGDLRALDRLAAILRAACVPLAAAAARRSAPRA